MLTTAPIELLQTLHHRMSVIIAPSHALRWLDPGVQEVDDLLVPFSTEKMTAYAVSTRGNVMHNDGPAMIQPVD